MVIREIKGLENGYFENIEGTSEWYYSHVSSKSFCDLYEAEEIVSDGYTFVGMSCALIHYPDGKVFKPFEMRENIYVEKPVFLNGKIYFLEVDFDKKVMRVIYIDSEELISSNFEDGKESNEDKFCNISNEDIKHVEAEISLSEVEDCYNLMLKISPMMITRAGNDGYFEIIYPEKKRYNIDVREGFDFRNGDDMYFASWDENPEYEDFIVVRDYESGEVKSVEKGSIFRMPNGEMWKI